MQNTATKNNGTNSIDFNSIYWSDILLTNFAGSGINPVKRV